MENTISPFQIKPLKTGTLFKGVLKPVAAHHKMAVEEVLEKLDL